MTLHVDIDYCRYSVPAWAVCAYRKTDARGFEALHRSRAGCRVDALRAAHTLAIRHAVEEVRVYEHGDPEILTLPNIVAELLGYGVDLRGSEADVEVLR